MTDLFKTNDGNLYNTDIPEWYLKRPLRKNFSITHRDINSINDLKATLREGEYVWPGGYQIAFITNDGGLLCFDCVKDNLASIMYSIKHDINDGWKIIHTDIIYDPDNCSHCSKEI
jgi:hypothetical protein